MSEQEQEPQFWTEFLKKYVRYWRKYGIYCKSEEPQTLVRSVFYVTNQILQKKLFKQVNISSEFHVK
jgi:hypothetical protein